MNVKDMFDLTGKTAIITEGASGLGSQIARGLAEVGANLVIASRKIERNQDVASNLSKLGIRAISVGCDFSKADDCQRLVDETIKEFGSLDILVNNAGYTWGDINYPIDKWQQLFEIKVTGLFQLSVISAQVMKKQGRGKIINISSLAGLDTSFPAFQNKAEYKAILGVLFTLTEDLALKWAGYGINVNAVAPGFFPNNMNYGLLKRGHDLIIPMLPLKRLGSDDDLKGAIVFLSSAASDYVTGHCLIVDGGQTITL